MIAIENTKLQIGTKLLIHKTTLQLCKQVIIISWDGMGWDEDGRICPTTYHPFVFDG